MGHHYVCTYNTKNDEPVDFGAILRQIQLVVFPKKIEKDNPGCYTGWFMGNIWNICWFIGKYGTYMVIYGRTTWPGKQTDIAIENGPVESSLICPAIQWVDFPSFLVKVYQRV